MRKIKYDYFNVIDVPTFVLSNVYHHHIGVITNIDKDSINIKFNMSSAQEVSFDVYKEVNGEECELWDEIHSLRYVYIPEHEEYYVISEAIDEDSNTVKHITLSSAGEWELSNRIIRNLEINTEADIKDEKYQTRVICNMLNTAASTLHMALKDKAPDWSIEYVDPKLAKKQRVFSVNNQSIYDFFTKTIAQELDCLFVFDSVFRKISVYDLLNTCNDCGERGEFLDNCIKCGSRNITYGYGKDSNIYISYENYAQKISVTDSGTSAKNCFSVIGGDDDINASIRLSNPTGTDYLYNFSAMDYDDMPPELVTKLNEYRSRYNSKMDQYQMASNLYYKALNERNYYKTTMMPRAGLTLWESEKGYNVGDKIYVTTLPSWAYLECTKAGVSGTKEFDGTDVVDGEVIKDGAAEWTVHKSIIAVPGAQQTADDLVTYFGSNNVLFLDSIPTDAEINREIENLCALQINALLKAEVDDYTITKTSSSGTWRGTLHVYNNSENPTKDEYTTATFNINLRIADTLDKYEKYMRDKIDIRLDKADKTYTNVLEIDNISDFINEITQYSLDELTNILNTLQAALETLESQGITSETPYYLGWDVYTAVSKPIENKIIVTRAEMKYKERLVNSAQDEIDAAVATLNTIKDYLNLADFLGEDLYKVFFNYIREGSYSNSNYISTSLSDVQQLNSAKELLNKAQIELIKSSTLQYTLSDTLSNLLNTSEFREYKYNFEIGDYIICRADDNLYRLRLIQFSYAYSNPESISVTFSNVTRLGNYFSDAQDILSKAQSMTTSYDFVQKQVNKNTGTTYEVNDWKQNGMSSATNQIHNNNMQEIVVDEHGILARQYDEVKDDYYPQQFRITSNYMAFTKDGWEHTTAAIGRQSIRYYNKSTKQVETKTDYGIKADYIDSGSIYGTDIVAGNIYSRNYNGTTQVGSHLDLDNGNFSLASGAIKGTYNDSTGKYAITISGNNVTVADNVNVEAANFTAGDGITITNKQIAAIPYTAGEGITIENHVISADGSGGQGLQYWTETEHEIYQDVEEVIPGGWDADDEYIADSRENYYWYYDIPAYDPQYTLKKSNNKKAICARVKGKTTDSNENTRVWTVWISTDLEALNFEPNYDNPDYNQTSYMSARIKYNTLDEYVTLNYLGKTWYVTAFMANTPRKDEFSHILMSPQYPLLDKVYRYENEHPLTWDAILPTMMKDILDASHLAVSSNSKTAIGVNQEWTFYSGYDYNNTVTTDNATFKVNRDGTAYATDLMYGSGSSKTSLITALAGKQNKLTAGANITISDNTISATNTTYTAGDNISITNDVISATDTTYTAGSGITISDQNVISVSGGGTVVDVIVDGTTVVDPQTMIAEIDLTGKQDVLTAGTNIDITGGVISATDTTYTGTGVISISNENVISADLSSKQDVLTAGTNITITGATISATDTTYTAGDHIAISAQNVISADLSSKQDVLTAGDYISIDSENVISADLSSKQNVLTAGANITIENDTISAMSSNDYSGLEEKCGTWIDGKNLYRKVIVVDGSFTNLAEDVSDLDIETLVNLDALITNNGAKTKASVSNCTLSLSNNTISGTGSGMINYLVLEYTKTTDIVTDLSLFVTDVMSKDTSDVEEDDYVIIDSTEAGLRRYKV